MQSIMSKRTNLLPNLSHSGIQAPIKEVKLANLKIQKYKKLGFPLCLKEIMSMGSMCSSLKGVFFNMLAL